MRRAFVEEFYYALDDGTSNSTNSTCGTSKDCEDDSVMTKCCVNIVMTRSSTGEKDTLQRCMAEEIVQATWDWTLSTDTDEDDLGMTLAMQCIDSSFASYLSRFGIFAALALLVSTFI